MADDKRLQHALDVRVAARGMRSAPKRTWRGAHDDRAQVELPAFLIHELVVETVELVEMTGIVHEVENVVEIADIVLGAIVAESRRRGSFDPAVAAAVVGTAVGIVGVVGVVGVSPVANLFMISGLLYPSHD